MRREDYDFVIVGSGAGGLCAALAAKAEGADVVVLEKEALVGGTSARSGGAVWIPCNDQMKAGGVADSPEDALRYVRECVKEYSPAATQERIDAYIRTGPDMLRFLEAQGLRFRYAYGYSDYYDDRPGGKPLGRAIEAKLLDGRELGPWADKLNRYAMFAMPVYVSEFAALSNATRTMKGRITALRLGFRMALQKLRKAPIFGQGAALQGRLLQQALKRDVPVHLSTRVTELIVEGGAVAGVRAIRDGEPIEFSARKGVLVNAGGFSRNLAMRERYLPKPQETTDYSLVNPGDTGEVMEAMVSAGAALDQMDEAWWIVGGTRPDGMAVSHTLDLTKPHVIIVDARGRRYVNEAMAYMELGQTMFAHQAEAGSVPSWAIFDSRHRNRYTWAMAMPGKPPADWIESGYMKTADTLADLAAQCGLPAEALEATVARFNDFARAGKDADFGRGNRAYERMGGDPTSKPNPSLGTIEQGPFYAVQIQVGDVGTCGGVVTDTDGRVLRGDGTPIAGLYGCGNVAANCFGRSYPGPGITLGQSLIFGYRAARHALRSNRPS